jgi:hypothetical protein
MPGSVLVTLVASLAILREVFAHRTSWRFSIFWLVISLATFFLLIIRLAFLRHLIVPPYSDSPVHYRVIYDVLHPETLLGGKLSFANLLSSYYHFGYHSMTAWLCALTGIDPLDAMSLVPQMFLIVAPLSVFFLIFTLTNQPGPAAFAALLAAIGWMMPAYATNWGKFPALIAQAVFPAVAASWLRFRASPAKGRALLWGGLLILGAILLHTRIVICLALAAAGYYLSGKLQYKKQAGLVWSLVVSLFFGLFIWAFLRFWGEFYQGPLVWLILALLLPFGFWEYPRHLAAVFIFLLGLWGVMRLPLPGSQTLLDRQFLDMLLYIPFSLVGGLGLAGLMKKMPHLLPQKPAVPVWISIGLFCLVILNFAPKSSLVPNPCCNYFTEADRSAFQWIKGNSSEHTLFVISAFSAQQQKYGTDAGIWIYPLTGRGVNTLPYNTDWGLASFPEALCRFGAGQTFIYLGDADFSFKDSQLSRQPWLRLAFQQENVKIYEVTKCRK